MSCLAQAERFSHAALLPGPEMKIIKPDTTSVVQLCPVRRSCPQAEQTARPPGSERASRKLHDVDCLAIALISQMNAVACFSAAATVHAFQAHVITAASPHKTTLKEIPWHHATYNLRHQDPSAPVCSQPWHSALDEGVRRGRG